MYVHCMSWWCNSGSVFGNNLGQVVQTYVPLAQTSIIFTSQRKVVLSGWEGNRRSGIALAIQWLIHLRAYGLRKGDEHSDLPGRRRLRSSFTQQLLVPPYRLSTVGRRSFSVAASTFWNTLPSDIQSAPSLSSFRRQLKTFLFHQSFPDIIL